MLPIPPSNQNPYYLSQNNQTVSTVSHNAPKKLISLSAQAILEKIASQLPSVSKEELLNECSKANACISLGNYAQAIEVTENILEKDPQNIKAFQIKGKALYYQRKYAEIISFLDLFPEQLSNNSDLLALKAEACFQTNDMQLAFESAHQACNINPDQLNAESILVRSCLALGFNEQAFKVAYARLTKNAATNLGKIDSLIPYMPLLTQEGPIHPIVRNILAREMLLHGKALEAKQSAEKLLLENANDLFARNTLARALTDFAINQIVRKTFLEQAETHLLEVLESHMYMNESNRDELHYAYITSAKLHLLYDRILQAYETAAQLLPFSVRQDALSIFNEINKYLNSSPESCLYDNIKARSLVDLTINHLLNNLEKFLSAKEIAQNILQRPNAYNQDKAFAHVTLAKINQLLHDPLNTYVHARSAVALDPSNITAQGILDSIKRNIVDSNSTGTF